MTIRSTILGISAALAVCAVSGDGLAQADEKRLVFAGNETGSMAHRVASAIGGLVSRETDFTMVATAYTGPSVYVPLLEAGRADFGYMNGVDSMHAYQGTAPFYDKAHRNLRLASVGFTNYHGWVVRKDSPIRSAADLKGKRVAGVYSGHSTCQQLSSAHLANYGLSWDEVRVVPAAGAVGAVRLLGTGRADVATCAVVGMAVIRELDAQVGLRHISIDPSPEGVARFREEFRFGEAAQIPAGSGPAVVEDTYVWEYAFYLITTSESSDEAVYATVKSVWENIDNLRETIGAFERWHTERMASVDVPLPYHAGAIRYFKERGVWTDEMERELQALLQ